MRFFLFFALMMWCWPVSAQVVSITGLCQTLPEYRQGEGVEHVSGAEAGVVPADVNGGLVKEVPDVINIPVDVILAERFASVKIPQDLELKPGVATVSVRKDGRVEYNGQDISAQAYSLCGKSVVVPVVPAPLGDGQKGEDLLSSGPDDVEVKDGAEGEPLEGRYP
ncbi:MAG: hypothetical protein R3E13_02495 [Alphaproteobacteria bacterium]